MCWSDSEKAFYPIVLHIDLVCRGGVTCPHRQHIKDGSFPDPWMGVFINIFREIIADMIFELYLALGFEETYSYSG